MATNYRNKDRRIVHGGAATVTNPYSSSTNQYFGTATVGSWWTPVSAPLVAAASRISLTPQWLGAQSSVTVALAVCSLTAGTGFYICGNSFAYATSSLTCHWKIENPA